MNSSCVCGTCEHLRTRTNPETMPGRLLSQLQPPRDARERMRTRRPRTPNAGFRNYMRHAALACERLCFTDASWTSAQCFRHFSDTWKEDHTFSSSPKPETIRNPKRSVEREAPNTRKRAMWDNFQRCKRAGAWGVMRPAKCALDPPAPRLCGPTHRSPRRSVRTQIQETIAGSCWAAKFLELLVAGVLR